MAYSLAVKKPPFFIYAYNNPLYSKNNYKIIINLTSINSSKLKANWLRISNILIVLILKLKQI